MSSLSTIHPCSIIPKVITDMVKYGFKISFWRMYVVRLGSPGGGVGDAASQAKYQACMQRQRGLWAKLAGISVLQELASSLGFHVMRNTISSHSAPSLFIWTRCIDRENLNTTPLAYSSFPSLGFASCNPLAPSPSPFAPVPCVSLHFLLNAESRDSRLTAAPTPSPPSRRRNCKV